MKISANPEYQEFLKRYSQGFESFDAKESGASPFDKVKTGRCNPACVVFLYAASDENTATAEIRPYKEAVSIAALLVEKVLKLIDFYYEFDENGIRIIDNIFLIKCATSFLN